MKKISHIELGGTLFIPASHKQLNKVVNEGKFSGLKSLVIDFEDGLSLEDFDSAKGELTTVLENIDETSPLVFLRSRDEGHLEELLELESISKINGFILAKFSLLNADKYFELLEETEFLVMPSIEGSELFDFEKLKALKEKIVPYKEKVLLIRFGLEDMLRQLGMWRECSDTIFDLASTNTILGNLIGLFKSAGFAISGGVYPYYENNDGFLKDVKRDLKEGLFSKTIIHPNQIEFCNEVYKVTIEQLTKAEEIVERRDEAVFSFRGSLAEVSTMYPFALEILQRRDIYGIKNYKTSLK